LKQFGLEVRQVEDAVGFQNNIFKIRTLVEREFMEGVSSVFLHSKFPDAVPQVNEVEKLIKNESQASDAEAAVDEIALMEQAGAQDVPTGLPDLFVHVCRHYFLHGILEGLKDIGGINPARDSSNTVAIYRQAARLEDIGDFDEARRLFRLVLHRPDQQYWDRAEYHLGSIELRLGNSAGAHFHFNECLRLNPTNNKARRALNEPAHYQEIEPNVFERVAPPDSRKILFILFGDLGHVVNAFPVLTALEKKFVCETAWLTSPDHASLARASGASEVYETKTPGIIPWDWINSQGFTHVFFPEPGANHEEWEASGLDPIDFIARKCRVELKTRRPKFTPTAETLSHAEEFMRKHGLRRNAFITTAHGDIEKRRWPLSNLTKFVQNVDLSTVLFARKGDPQVPNTVTSFETPLELMTVLIEWSRFYLGPANGPSWLATMTDTPMAVFFDPRQEAPRNSFSEMLRGEKKDIQEWTIFTNLQTVLDHVEYTVSQTTGAR
jgi:hypothetical protein